MPAVPFRDPREAGRVLAGALTTYGDFPDTQILALPRGGVLVAYEVAEALHAPLDILLVRKLGVPGYAELAIGAIASGGFRVVNHDVLAELGLTDADVDRVAAIETREIVRREQALRGNEPPLQLDGRR